MVNILGRMVNILGLPVIEDLHSIAQSCLHDLDQGVNCQHEQEWREGVSLNDAV